MPSRQLLHRRLAIAARMLKKKATKPNASTSDGPTPPNAAQQSSSSSPQPPQAFASIEGLPLASVGSGGAGAADVKLDVEMGGTALPPSCGNAAAQTGSATLGFIRTVTGDTTLMPSLPLQPKRETPATQSLAFLDAGLGDVVALLPPQPAAIDPASSFEFDPMPFEIDPSVSRQPKPRTWGGQPAVSAVRVTAACAKPCEPPCLNARVYLSSAHVSPLIAGLGAHETEGATRRPA